MLPCSLCSAGLSSLLDAVAIDSVALLLTPASMGNHLFSWGEVLTDHGKGKQILVWWEILLVLSQFMVQMA